ncbi:MAG: adenylyltransferase/cytidyltransferase family protein [Clostridia bacterium]|nr:adenylyltransferase/cytidyltransferase family protein [Clostridia bacterium]
MKPYERGLIVGRFQIFHKGHEQIVRTALKLCSKVLILIGSSQESGTEKNPLSYEQRRDMILAVFGASADRGRLIIAPLPDIGVGNVPAWGRYVLSKAREALGDAPDLLVSGREERRLGWFDGCEENVSELYLPKTVDISASQMREWLISGDSASWRQYSPSALKGRFRALREAVAAAEGNDVTASL